jgi:transposase
MVRRLARIVGVGVETADLLVHEVLSRPMRDRRAVARYAGLTDSPDESGAPSRTRARQSRQRPGPPRVKPVGWRPTRHDPTRLALSDVQKESALALWYRARTADSRSGTRKTMIPAFARTALARKLIIALWRFVTTGEPLEGVVLRPAS